MKMIKFLISNLKINFKIIKISVIIKLIKMKVNKKIIKNKYIKIQIQKVMKIILLIINMKFYNY
jgi:hypothetical protein